jgi:predicted MPP superfamily phosphohydrolase
MEIKELNTNITSIDKIFHISDIHIRTLKRHKEYQEVFDNLFLHISQHATNQSICVLTGDIVHSKLDMSPELINMLTKFFNGFYIPTIVILGNHDMNLNNLYRLDAISPILDVINNKNIHFVKDNGLFKFGNVVFNHMAVDVAPKDYIKAKDFDAHYKIALHHGAVHNAKTDIGFQISNDHVTTDLFEGHDLTLLGDIHKPAQFLNKEKTIGYPGSLIQQNHGEVLDHGILVWDLPDKTSEFIEIKNDYGYVTFEVENAKIKKSPHRIPAKPRVRIKFTDTDASDIKKLIATIRKKYKVQDISIQRTANHIESNKDGSIAIGNVRDVEHQNNLITNFINENYPDANKKELDAIRHINRTINSKLPVLESVRNVTWYPVSFEFDNMFSYGEKNKVDFSKLSDVIGLFASNASGKSSLLDAIIYTIFDKCSKTSKSKEVLNNKKSGFKGIFKFKLNNKLYTIEREGITLKHGHVKVNVNFYNEDENLNGEERSDTNKSIRRYLGTYDDFILTAFSLQADNNNFIEKSQRERKDLLSQFLDTTVFEQLYHLASEEIKETSGKLKEYKKIDFGYIIKESDDIIIENQDTIIELEKNDNDLQNSRNNVQNDIVELIESKQPMSYDGPDISELEATENQLISNIENIEISINELEDIITKMPEFDPVSINELNLQKNQKDILNKDIKIVTKELTQLEQLIKLQQQKIDHLKTHEYDHTCKYCVSNIFVKEAEEAKIELPKNQKLADIAFTKQFELQTKRDIIQDTILKYQEQIDLSNKLEKFELQLQVLESDLQTKESELETINERQELFKKNETAIIHNNLIDKKIKTKKDLIIDIVSTLKGITDKVKSNHGEIEVAKTKKKTALEQLETYKQLETEYKAYEYYLQSVKRDGVPYELIKKALPKIETEINNVLDQVVDFNMVLNTDGKNINGYIIYDEDNFWPLELTSGMERFMSSLAIRVALINVSALPRPNFIAIDEGWGSLDREHISAVTNLFEYFRTKFDFSIIISHVESMRDMVDNLIEVNKINNFSQIQHT